MRPSESPRRRGPGLGARRWVIAGGLILGGLLLMAYPFISNFLYERQQQNVIYQYQQQTQDLDDPRLEDALDQAQAYNAALRESHFAVTDPFDPDSYSLDNEVYTDLLNLSGDGLMGYIEIPAISVYLPIYHGTSDQVLQQGVGHLENTSLPIGGEGTHAVLSAHSGLSGKKLFTDLSLLVEGDLFYLHVLGQTLAYQVDQIRVVLPYETEDLRILPDEDLVTLVTCTPYGINSHRLLVRGTAVPYTPEPETPAGQTSQPDQPERGQSVWMRQYVQAMAAGLVLLLAVFLLAEFLTRRKRDE